MTFFIGVKARREYIVLNPLLFPFEDKGRKHMASVSVVCGLGLDAAPSSPPAISHSSLLYKLGPVATLWRAALRASLHRSLEEQVCLDREEGWKLWK